jgi:hypothetical protein
MTCCGCEAQLYARVYCPRLQRHRPLPCAAHSGAPPAEPAAFLAGCAAACQRGGLPVRAACTGTRTWPATIGHGICRPAAQAAAQAGPGQGRRQHTLQQHATWQQRRWRRRACSTAPPCGQSQAVPPPAAPTRRPEGGVGRRLGGDGHAPAEADDAKRLAALGAQVIHRLGEEGVWVGGVRMGR